MKFYSLNSNEELREKNILYNNFITDLDSNTEVELTQSNFWFDFSQKEKKEVFKIIILSDDQKKVLASALFIKNNFSFLYFIKLSYLYCPRGPIFNKNLTIKEKEEVFYFITRKIKDNFKAIFFRFEPIKDFKVVIDKDKKRFKKTINLQPAKTLMIDLKKGEEEILREMHQKTRYNIRLAKKKGLKIVKASNVLVDKSLWEKDFNDFWQLLKKTSQRDSFNLHSKEHYYHLLSLDSKIIRLFFVEHEGKRIATGIFSFFANKVTYLHGASDNDYRNLMAPQLLQFEIIKKAKLEGYLLYDFYGIDELKWPGVTKFKRGFGGFVSEYAGTYDFVFQIPVYFIYNFLRRTRRLLKSFIIKN